MSKYHARPVTAEGHRFDSQAEYRRYLELQLLERAGTIAAVQVHPRYELLPKAGDCRAVHYEADFAYTEQGRSIVEDVKGVETPVFKIKLNLFRRRYPDLELRIVEA